MSKTKKRKGDHIRICINEDVQAHSVKTGLNDVILVHRSIPRVSLEDVDLSIKVFNHDFSAPIIIEAMTGGTKKGAKINAALAESAEAFGLGMGVGSQRAAIENPNLAYTFKIARKKAPNAFLIANLGASQIEEYNLKKIKRAIDMIEADALALHLNPLQEVIQPEGTPHHSKLLEKIEEVVANLSIPLIVKETGAGIAFEEAQLLSKIGVKAIDVAGAGGTSWAAVESYRARELGDQLHLGLGKTFWDWGIPTAVSVVEVSQSVNLEVIASGGLRSGVDIAKVLSLGADFAGFAFPLLKPAVEGTVKEYLQKLVQELRMVMFLVGSKSIWELKSSSVIIVGKTAQWLDARGFKTKKYARRS